MLVVNNCLFLAAKSVWGKFGNPAVCFLLERLSFVCTLHTHGVVLAKPRMSANYLSSVVFYTFQKHFQSSGIFYNFSVVQFDVIGFQFSNHKKKQKANWSDKDNDIYIKCISGEINDLNLTFRVFQHTSSEVINC